MRTIGLCRIRTVLVLLSVWGTVGAVLAQDSVTRDLKRAREERPWLRINAGGHTGTVQALAFTPDSGRLCSAGLDKVVQVWNLAAARDLRRGFLRERTIRWQVARGLRGSVYALASAPGDGLLAIGGYGAMGLLGEIILVDPVDGSLVKVLDAHRQTVRSLSFSADGNWLASMDVAGQAMLWKRAEWQPITLYKPDREHLGPKKAELIERQPKFRPIVIAGNSHVILPYFVGNDSDVRLRWRLVQIGLADRKDFKVFDTLHYGVVKALAAAADGSRLASADEEGNLYLWDLNKGGRPERLDTQAVVNSLCFSPDAKTLAVGTANLPGRSQSQLQIWDVDNRKITQRRPLPDHVFACAISPDGRRLAYTGGEDNEVYVDWLRAAEDPVKLRGTGKRILKVAFAKDEPFYRVAFGTGPYRGFNDYADLQESYDTTQLALGSDAPLKPSDWISAEWWRGEWLATPRPDGSLQLLHKNVPKGIVPLDPRLEGKPRCYCWIPDAQGNPFALAVGTDVQNSVYVYRLDQRATFPILRHFRGHHDSVASVGVSRDLRYLVSGSADGTVKIWSLADYQQGKATSGRWGADFEQRGEQLVATVVHPAGPLFHKGLRVGDVLTEIIWQDGQRKQRDPAAILQQLRELPWGTQVWFAYTRNAAPQPGFQLVPAWQPLATLFVSTKREWAFWTPQGYYDASLNGHRLFGWQVNRGMQKLPDFYRADQFYKKLERPDVIEKLLPAGSLQQAFRLAAKQPPPRLHEALPQQIAATPRVKIITPVSDTLIRENSTKVRAEVEVPVPAAGKMVQAKAFANGVVATGQRIVEEEDVDEGKKLTYEWDVPLPKDERNLIQVVVGTDAPTAAFSDVIVKHDPQPIPPPKLYVLALAVNEYGDAAIQALAYPVADAEGVVKLLKSRSKGLYALDEAALLTNKNVTPEMWRKAVGDLRKKLKDVAKPDDLLIFFLAGHGVVDEKTQKYYFVGHGLKMAELKSGAFAECISWDDFRSLADIPCRKLALLDTCHSGAIQPPRSRNLKTAVRQLQEDVIFTVTASTGEQKSMEKRDWRHGAFTKCLLEALDGQADESRDGVVTLDELVTYVKRSVPKLTAGVQTPTAAPDDILPFTSLPLTRIE